MSWIYPTAGVWLAFFLGAAAFAAREKPWGGKLRAAAAAAAILAGGLFLLWGWGARG